MSSKLISHKIWQHDFRDDLESSVYVLLWVTLMYSSCSDAEHVVPFMKGVLDPQPHKSRGGFGKADFLQGRSFLKQVNFPNRSALHNLIDQLAQLFAVRYEEPPDSCAREEFEQLLNLAQNQPGTMTAIIHNQSAVAFYDRRMDALKGHVATIQLFDEALANRSQWPTADAAAKQNIYASIHAPRAASYTLKTGWSTTLIINEMEVDVDSCDETDEEDPFQIVSDDSLSEMTDSDRLTVGDSSPTLLFVNPGS